MYSKFKIILFPIVSAFLMSFSAKLVSAEILVVGSGINGNTKVTKNLGWLSYNWNINPDFNDSSWQSPFILRPGATGSLRCGAEGFSNDYWDPCWSSLNYIPNGGDPGIFGNGFTFFADSSAKVIQADKIKQPGGQKNYYRTSYTIPAGSTINNARLYIGVDDVAQVVVGEIVNFEPFLRATYGNLGGSFSSGCGNSYPINQWVNGSVGGFTASGNYLANTDVTNLVKLSLDRNTNNKQHGEPVKLVIGVEVANSCVPDEPTNPMGVQYALYIDYTPPKNDPPVCGTVTKSPNQSSYLPSSIITFTANSTDPEGKNITYSNWRVKSGTSSTKGVFTSRNDLKTVTYRTPNTNSNEVIEYTISDGTPANTKQCTFNLSTQNKYLCNSNNQCVLDAGGNYSSIGDCLSGCESRFTCNSSFQCVPSTTGLYLNKASCDNACKSPSDSDVSCQNIIFTKNGNNALVSAKVNNFTNLSTTYSWSSIYNSNSLYGSNSECTSPTYCTMKTLNSSYTTPAISYTLPPAGVEDTITLKINNDPNKTCTYVVNGKNITLSFDKPVYSGSVNTTFEAVLTVQASDNFNVNYDLVLNCPGLNCLFKDTSTNTKRINFSQSSVSKRQDFIVTVTGPNSGNGYNIEGLGTSLDGDADLSKIAVSKANIYGPKSLSVNVKQVDNFLNKLSYCDSYSALQDLTGDATLSINKGNLSIYSGSFKNASNTIALGTGYSFNLSAANTDKEVYCTKVITDSQTYLSRSGPSTFNVSSTDTNVTLIAVVGPKTTGGWFKAFGGNGHANSGYESNVPNGNVFFAIYKNIQDGVVTAVKALNPISGLTESKTTVNSGITKQNHLSTFRGIFQKSIENTNYRDAINLSYDKDKSFDQYSLDKNSDKSKFYYLEVTDTLKISSDFKITDKKAVPILFVKSASNGNGGNVRITKDVSRLDLILIADGEVLIESPEVTCEQTTLTKVGNQEANYFIHVYQQYINGGWRPTKFAEYINLTSYKTTGVSDWSLTTFSFAKPSDSNYVKVTGYWVQSGTIVQNNETSRLSFNINGEANSIICPDMDLGEQVTQETQERIKCPDVFEGSINDPNLVITPEFTGTGCNITDNTCNGSHMTHVSVEWFKKSTNTTGAGCTQQGSNLVVNGAIIANDTILMQSDNLVLQGSDASETFYFRPEVYFSDDETSEGFKSINIYLKTLD